MIYPKPRRRMNVDRMRHQRDKHNPIRYYINYFSRLTLTSMEPFLLEWVKEDMIESFRMQVDRWNMWQPWELSPITLSEHYDLDYDRYRLIVEVRRIKRLTTHA